MRSIGGRVLAVLLGVSLFLSGCGDDGSSGDGDASSTDSGDTTDSESTDGDASATDGDATSTDSSGTNGVDTDAILRVGTNIQQADQTNLDPRISTTAFDVVYMSALYAPLMRYDREANEYSPYLAESVEVVDPQTVEIVLRDDAVFDNGDPVTSADAAATMEALLASYENDTCNGCNAAIELVDRVEVVDDRTYVWHMTAPATGVVFELLGGRESFVVPASAGAEQNTDPVGNGPFSFESLVPGQQMTMSKSPSFFDADSVQLAGIEFVNLEGGTPQVNGLLAGDVDIAHEVGPNQFSEVESRGFGVFQVPDRNSAFDYINICKLPGTPWADETFRRALYIGTDREALASTTNQVPLYGLWGSDDPRSDPSIEEEYGYDPDRARELLEEAGLAGTTVDLVVVQNILPQWPQQGLILESQWEELGLEVNVNASTDLQGDFSNYLRDNEIPPLGAAGLTGFSRPGLQRLNRLLTPGGANNACNYDEPRITEIAGELASLDPSSDEAVELRQEAQRIVAEQAILIPLAVAPQVSGWADNIVGMDPDTITVPFFADWTSVHMTG